MKKEPREDQFDAMLRSAFQAHAKTMEPELETKAELQAQGIALHQFSPEFDENMKKLGPKDPAECLGAPPKQAAKKMAAAAAAVALGIKRILDCRIIAFVAAQAENLHVSL